MSDLVITYKSYREAHEALMEADRTRSRILNRVMAKQAGGESRLDRLSNRAWDQALEKARRHPDYQEANETFKAISQYIRDHFPATERRADQRLARRMGF